MWQFAADILQCTVSVGARIFHTKKISLLNFFIEWFHYNTKVYNYYLKLFIKKKSGLTADHTLQKIVLISGFKIQIQIINIVTLYR